MLFKHNAFQFKKNRCVYRIVALKIVIQIESVYVMVYRYSPSVYAHVLDIKHRLGNSLWTCVNQFRIVTYKHVFKHACVNISSLLYTFCIKVIVYFILLISTSGGPPTGGPPTGGAMGGAMG